MAAGLTAMLLLLALTLPALGAPAGPTKLLAPDVAPRTADTSTPVTFSVTYRNAHDLPPDYVRVVVGSTTYALAGTGTDWKAGVLFTITTTLPAGVHAVLFEARDEERFPDAQDGGTVTVGQAAQPDPTPAPNPTPAPAPTPTPRPAPTPQPTAPSTTTPGRTPAPAGGSGSGSGGSGSGGGSSGDSTDGSSGGGLTGVVAMNSTGGPDDRAGGSSTAGVTMNSTGGPDDRGTGTGSGNDTGTAAGSGANGAAGSGSGLAESVSGGAGGDSWPHVWGGGLAESVGGGAGGDSWPHLWGGNPATVSAGGLPLTGDSSSTGSNGVVDVVSLGESGGDLSLARRVGDATDWLRDSFGGGLAAAGLTGRGHLPTLPAVIGSTVLVTSWMAFMLFNKRRRDGEPPAADDVLHAAAATGMGLAAVVAPSPLMPIDPESLMPRWRRPSLLEARKTDPIRAPAPERPKQTFGRGMGESGVGAERRPIRYAVIPLLDRPDEIQAMRIGELVAGDEVQVERRSGAYCLVLCPDGREGWVHRTTLGEVIPPVRMLAGRSADMDTEPESENSLAATLMARSLR